MTILIYILFSLAIILTISVLILWDEVNELKQNQK